MALLVLKIALYCHVISLIATKIQFGCQTDKIARTLVINSLFFVGKKNSSQNEFQTEIFFDENWCLASVIDQVVRFEMN